jgi:glucose-6-phosphate 1-dehydrogenase
MGSATLPADAPVSRPAPAPCTLVLFGATGDLARRKLLPALYNLAEDGLLPRGFGLIGVSRSDLGDEVFRERVSAAVRRYSRRPPKEEVLTALLATMSFTPGDFADEALHTTLADLLGERERGSGAAERLFYLSTAPEHFSPIIERLGAVDAGQAGTRILIEKPFGRSAQEARDFNATVLSNFSESQVFRIDHYLGKEEVQNILALRFGNSMIEPFWNAGTIAAVQITAAEDLGVGSRAGYYEDAGALRDHLQNHILQLLCMIAMEPPADLSAVAMRDRKVAVLDAIVPPGPGDAVAGQYGPGAVDGRPVPGYLEEPGVAPGSRTETYVAVRLRVENRRWAGVPFYLRTGKRLARKESEIAVALRPTPHLGFQAGEEPRRLGGQLVIGLKPQGGFRLTLQTKLPGMEMRLRPATMTVPAAELEDPGREAYERLLLDAMRGDPTLFTRDDEIEGQWRICDPLMRAFAERDAPLALYAAGSQGPPEADGLLWGGDAWRLI